MSISGFVERGAVQSASAGLDPGPVTISSPTVGSLCIAMIDASVTNTPVWTSITGTNWTGASAWTRAPNPLNTTRRQEIWYAIVPSSPGTTLTFNFTGSLTGATTYKVIEIQASGGWTTPPDVSNANTGNSTNPATGTITPATTGKNGFIVAFYDRGTAVQSAGPTNGFTAMTPSSPLVTVNYAYLIVNTGITGTYSTDWTVLTSGAWGASYAIFEEVGGAAPTSNASAFYRRRRRQE